MILLEHWKYEDDRVGAANRGGSGSTKSFRLWLRNSDFTFKLLIYICVFEHELTNKI
jgi:hypothetical protein